MAGNQSGPVNIAHVHSARCAAGRNSEAIRMAYVPHTYLNFSEKWRNRVQSDAGVAAAFLVAIYVDVYTRAISLAKHAAPAAVLALVFASETNSIAVAANPPRIGGFLARHMS